MDNDGDRADYADDAAGGGIRGFIRAYIARFTRSVSMGSIPIPRNPAKLGKTLSSVGQVVDLHGAVTEASSSKRPRGWLQIAKASVPVLVKNSLLGALQFTVFDFTVARTKSAAFGDDNDEQIRAIPIALFGGFMSGSLHGAGHLLWDHVAAAVSKEKEQLRKLSVVSRGGTLILHAITNSTLFGTYAATKYVLHPAPDEPKTKFFESLDKAQNEEHAKIEVIHRLLSISFAGFLAGCAEETVNHKLDWMQTIKKHRGGSVAMNPRLILMGGLPSLVGFLALELG